MRKSVPEIIIRTTLIVGFPEESDNDFKELVDFVEKTKFDKLGVFEYSKEEGTKASLMRKQIDENTKKLEKKK